MTLSSRHRRPSYADVATPKRESDIVDTDNKSNVKVVVRIRPENGQEKSGNYRVVVKAMNEHVLVFDPNEQSSPEYGYRRRHQRRDIRKRQNKDLKFAFDYVFHPGSANHEIYHQTTEKILDSFLEGYNCSVFAYGATGAGKTHTMLGNPEKPGVMYLTMMELYNRMEAMEGDRTYDVAVSYLEVYNEQIRDLLMGGKTLPVREDSQNGVVVPGLSLHKPRDADELLHMLHYGNKNRTQHPTDANAESSRSHAVFQVFVRQRDRTANISAEVKVAKLCLVDLAGSERATVTTNRGKRFREGANINRSLLALGNVINALADPKYKGHVPYRDSKLTRLLKDSLGGNCKTVMIAAVSPSSMTYEDTYNTLKYADRAKNIQSTLKKNVLNVDFHVARYGQIVEELRKEIIELKEKLRYCEEGKLVQAVNQTSSVEVCRLKEKLDGVFCTRLKFCREFLDAELKSRDLEWKIHRKEKCLARMALVCDNTTGIAEKLKKLVASTRHRLNSFHGNRDKCVKSLLDNKKIVTEMEESIKSHSHSAGDNLETENLKLTLHGHQTSMALTESQYCVKYLTKVVKSQEREIQSSERMIHSLLSLVRQQHFIIKGSNMMTSDLEGEFQQIQSMAEGREVSFADQTFNAGNQSFSLSGLLDFKSFPSEEVNTAANGILDSTYGYSQQTEKISQQSCHFVNETENTYKSTAFAGHTPFPNKHYIRNEENSTTQSECCVTQSESGDVQKHVQEQIVTNVYSTTNPGLHSVPKSNSSINRQFHCLETAQKSAISTSCGSVVNACVQQTTETLNSTFTLEENDDEQNSTFTLMETSDKDPEVLARTPVIEDKFSRSTRNLPVENKNLDSLNIPHVESYTEQIVNKVNVNLQNHQVIPNVDIPSLDIDSASNMVPYLSQTGQCQIVAASAQSCDNLTALQSLNCVPALQNQYSSNISNVDSLQTQIHYGNNLSALQSQNHHEENGLHVSALQSQNHHVGNGVHVSALHSQNQHEGNRNLSQNSDSVSVLQSQNNLTFQQGNSLSQSSHSNCTIANSILSNVSLGTGTIAKTGLDNGNGVSRTELNSGIDNRPGVSKTVTKEKPDVLSDSQVKSHAVRAITFGGTPCTPDPVQKVRSYAEVAQTPPQVKRTPLREMNNNTPLSDQTQGRQTLSNKMMMKKENLSGENNEVKETSRKLNELGLPSLMERWHTDPRKHRQPSAQKPSYMQPTKAYRYRHKTRHVNNENMEPSRVPMNQNNKNRSYKRSQSVSNVSRPGWQI